MCRYTFSRQHGVTEVAALLLSLQLGEEQCLEARLLVAPHLSSTAEEHHQTKTTGLVRKIGGTELKKK